MKEKVLTFIIGFLVGAIVATGGFFIYDQIRSKNVDEAQNNNPQQIAPNGQMMPGGGFKGGNFGGPKGDMTPPDMQSQEENSTEQNSEQSVDNSTQTTKNTNGKQKMKGNSNGVQNDGTTPPEMPNNNQTT